MATKKAPTTSVETPEEAAAIAAEKLAKRQAAAAKAAKTRAANAAKRKAAQEAAEQAKREEEKAVLAAQLEALEPEPAAAPEQVVSEVPVTGASQKTRTRKAAAPKVSVDEAPNEAASAAEPESVSAAVSSASPKTSAASQGEPTKESSNAVDNWIKRVNAWLDNAFPSSKNAVLGGIAGLLVALLFFAIGFGKTLFIVVLVLIGVAVGQYADGDPKLVRTISKLTKKR